jgi:hypothetical protein
MIETQHWLAFLFQHLHVFQMSDFLFTWIKIGERTCLFVPVWCIRNLMTCAQIVSMSKHVPNHVFVLLFDVFFLDSWFSPWLFG